jgi:hypothetical protein
VRDKVINSQIKEPFGSILDYFIFGYPNEKVKPTLDIRKTEKDKGNRFSLSFRTNICSEVCNLRVDNEDKTKKLHYDIADKNVKYLNHAEIDLTRIKELDLLEDIAVSIFFRNKIFETEITNKEIVESEYGELFKFHMWLVKYFINNPKESQLVNSFSFMVGYPHNNGRCKFENLRAREMRELLRQYNETLNKKLKSIDNVKTKEKIYLYILHRQRSLMDFLDSKLKEMDTLQPENTDSFLKSVYDVVNNHYTENIENVTNL